MNVIVNQATGTAHIVGDVSKDDLVDDGLYFAWTDCGIAVTGKLVKIRKGAYVDWKCNRCFKRQK